MQNAVSGYNAAQTGMIKASDRMLNSFNNINFSQPLRPSFAAAAVHDELSIKADETKAAVYRNLIKALEKKLAADVKRSAPNYAGIDYKA